jgi:hypothetical protein
MCVKDLMKRRAYLRVDKGRGDRGCGEWKIDKRTVPLFLGGMRNGV